MCIRDRNFTQSNTIIPEPDTEVGLGNEAKPTPYFVSSATYSTNFYTGPNTELIQQ